MKISALKQFRELLVNLAEQERRTSGNADFIEVVEYFIAQVEFAGLYEAAKIIERLSEAKWAPAFIDEGSDHE